MKMLLPWILFTTTFTPVFSSKILYLATVPSLSHGMWNTVLATELAKRGHEVTYITPSVIKDVHPNVTVNYFKQPDELLMRKKLVGVRLMDRSGDQIIAMADNTIYECEIMFENEPYKSLLNSTKHYDLIIFEYIGHDCLFGLSHKFKSAPIVLVGALPYLPIWTYRNLGAPLFHMTPTLAQSTKRPFDFVERLVSMFNYIKQDFVYYMYMRPEMDRIVKKHFGDTLPVKDLWKKVSVYLVNAADWMNKTPVPPNIIPIGGIHLSEPKPLKKQILDFLEESEHGVILISFGAHFQTGAKSIPTFRMIESAVAKLPQRVLLKWYPISGFNITFSKNVLALPWIPQNDVLGHPKMRLFVSHCGGQSTLEAAYHGVPILAVPGIWDQSENANRIVAENAGIRLDFDDITEETFLETAKELMSNPRYREGALKLKRVMRDPPMRPLDRAIFWVEFVIRHKGATHLRPILWDLSHPYVLLFDIAVVIIVITLSVLFSVIVVLYLVCSARKCYVRRRVKNKCE